MTNTTPLNIHKFRAVAGMTQQQLADAMGVHQVTVARWETGTRNITGPHMRLLKLVTRKAAKKNLDIPDSPR